MTAPAMLSKIRYMLEDGTSHFGTALRHEGKLWLVTSGSWDVGPTDGTVVRSAWCRLRALQ